MKKSLPDVLRSAPQRNRIVNTICFLLLLIAFYLFNWYNDRSEAAFYDKPPLLPDAATVHYIDVGQGDATLIQLPTGENVLIDAGTNESETALLAYLDNAGVRSLDYVIFTHPHEDHIGGADKILLAYDIRHVILSTAVTESSTYDRMLDSISQSNASVFKAYVGDTYKIGENAALTILGPVFSEPENLNDASIILRFDYKEASFLFTGDTEAAAESAAIAVSDPVFFDVDVLHVGHHGSSTSSSEPFLSAVTPQIAVISCGENNDYAHPHTAVLDSLRRFSALVFRTDENGCIRVCTDGTQYVTDTEKRIQNEKQGG